MAKKKRIKYSLLFLVEFIGSNYVLRRLWGSPEKVNQRDNICFRITSEIFYVDYSSDKVQLIIIIFGSRNTVSLFYVQCEKIGN